MPSPDLSGVARGVVRAALKAELGRGLLMTALGKPPGSLFYCLVRRTEEGEEFIYPDVTDLDPMAGCGTDPSQCYPDKSTTMHVRGPFAAALPQGHVLLHQRPDINEWEWEEVTEEVVECCTATSRMEANETLERLFRQKNPLSKERIE